jgi:hypothetical protein
MTSLRLADKTPSTNLQRLQAPTKSFLRSAPGRERQLFALIANMRDAYVLLLLTGKRQPLACFSLCHRCSTCASCFENSFFGAVEANVLLYNSIGVMYKS